MNVQHVQHAQTGAKNTVPRNNEAETTGRSLGSNLQTKTDGIDCASVAVDGQEAQSYGNRLATVTAQLAARGFSLYPLHDETLLVTRWNMTRVLPSIGAAESFLRMVGGQP